jgi:hypothetical protein
MILQVRDKQSPINRKTGEVKYFLYLEGTFQSYGQEELALVKVLTNAEDFDKIQVGSVIDVEFIPKLQEINSFPREVIVRGSHE